MKKIIAFMHTSVDGFIAGPNREIDWVHIDGEIFDYVSQQITVADTALYGRITYELMESYWPGIPDTPGAPEYDVDYAHWYNKVEKIVLSHSLKNVHKENTRIISDNAFGEIKKLKQKAGKNMIMFGSPGTVRSLVDEGLIDEFWIFMNPVILGEGMPYLQHTKTRVALKLAYHRQLSSGVVCLQYLKA